MNSRLQVVFMDGAYRGEIKSRIEKETGIEVKITLRSDAKKRFRANCHSMDCGTNIRLVESLQTAGQGIRADHRVERM